MHFGMRQIKTFIFILLIFISLKGISQVNCDISIDTEIPVCRNTTFQLSVEESDNSTYEWKKDGVITGGPTAAILVQIDDQSLFTVKVTNEISGETCESESYLVTTHPEIYVDFEQLQLTCTNGDNDNGNTAKVRAIASGVFEADEYEYFWDVRPIQIAPGDPTVALGLKAHLNYTIMVKDNYGCFEKDTVWTEAYDNPTVEIFSDPDTAFVQKPHIDFSFINHSEDTIPLSNYFWDFGDCPDEPNDSECHSDPNKFIPNPRHSYFLNDEEIEDGGKEYMTIFTALNPQGCDTSFTHTVRVKPMRLLIPNVFTPNNGDDVNNFFVITELKINSSGEEGTLKNKVAGVYTPDHYYERTDLVVFNRHGRIIFKDDNYQNDWDGDNLAEGVYFYVLKASGPRGTDTYKGSVSIIRGR
jgi:hypothetical protein